MLSAFTRGQQMVPVLNAIGVHAAAVGNHDLDFSIAVFNEYTKVFKFPWLLANALDPNGQPLGGAIPSKIIEWQGVRVGLMGLVERDWLLTIPSIEADKDIVFLDFVEEGRRLAAELKSQGAEIIIALTHMRHPNDVALASQVPEIQLILGGHDHDYFVESVAPHGTMIFKSGTDFREFSIIHVALPATPEEPDDDVDCHDVTTLVRPVITWERVEVTGNVPEDPDVAAIVAGYQNVMGTRMDEPLGRSFVDLDARFDTVRLQESNAGNLLGDIMRLGLGADAAFLNGGTIRSDSVHPAGRLKMRDFVTMLPFTDELVVLRLTGKDVLNALETGVSSWPRREGRFLQVSGISFRYDSTQIPGARIVPGSVVIGDQPLQLDRVYKVATKAYLRSGKDGFDALKRAEVEIGGETAPRLATLVHYLLTRIEELNIEQGANTEGSADEDGVASEHDIGGRGDFLQASGAVATAIPAAAVVAEEDGQQETGPPKQGMHCIVASVTVPPGRELCAVSKAPGPPKPCAHGLDALYRFDRATGQFGIAPLVDGRIVNVATELFNA